LPHRAAAAFFAIAVLFFGDSLAALALRSLRLLSFSRATAATFFCGGSFPEDCPSEVNDWTIPKTTSFMERDSFPLLERFGMGLFYTLNIRDGKQGTLHGLTLDLHKNVILHRAR
jgi:hypothetical protein